MLSRVLPGTEGGEPQQGLNAGQPVFKSWPLLCDPSPVALPTSWGWKLLLLLKMEPRAWCRLGGLYH